MVHIKKKSLKHTHMYTGMTTVPLKIWNSFIAVGRSLGPFQARLHTPMKNHHSDFYDYRLV